MARLLTIEIPVSHGALEGLLRLPDDETTQPQMAAVVCHPHPAHGGTMHNKVVFRVAQALGDLGIPALRFNFRGVGRSTGFYDNGNGEREDVRAALDEIARRFPGVPICLAGFSFGTWVGLPVGCADSRVRQLIGVGVPTSLLTTDALAGCHKPKLIIQGENDQYGPQSSLRPWYDALPEPKSLTVVPRANHFLAGHESELQAAILAYFRSGVSATGNLTAS
ncbi:MAG TPA: alpha/beta family hydrolase [Ktedonobacterales bacterium]|nr:alpha/beta family hydrolase [Ktedonobacterales bacterium]